MKQLYEPSTYAGLAALFQMLGNFFPQYAPAFHVATAVTGATAVALREGQE